MSAKDAKEKPDDEVRVSRAPDRQRFEITVAGERAGFAAFLDDGSRRILYHTVVEDRFAGRGLAGRLVTDALADTRAAGLRIVPICPYVARYLQSHHQFEDAVDPVTPEALERVVAVTGG